LNYNDFLIFLLKIGDLSLPGNIAHFQMSVPNRKKIFFDLDIKKKKINKAAVLVLINPSINNEPTITLIVRPNNTGVHSGQISFPGGRVEKIDNSLWETALRETNEEIGVNPCKVNFIKELSRLYIPPSNFLVYPFIGYLNERSKFRIDNNEVDEVLEIPISSLIDKKNRSKMKITNSYMKNIEVPCYKFNKKLIWGATAMILSEFELLLHNLLNNKLNLKDESN